jgi:hypothetical protein
MMTGKPEMPEGSAVGAQLAGRHPGRHEALFAEQFAHRLDSRRPISTTLDQSFQGILSLDARPSITLSRVRREL